MHSQIKSGFQTPLKSLRQERTTSPYNLLDYSENRNISKDIINKVRLTKLIKKLAEYEIREQKYIEKIKYLQTLNHRITREHQEKLKSSSMMNSNIEIQNLVKSYQQEFKKISQSNVKLNNNQKNQNNFNKQFLQLSREKQNWIKKYEQLILKSNQQLEQEKLKKLELQFENKFLQEKLKKIEAKLEESISEESKVIQTNQQKDLHIKISILSFQIEKLQKQNKELRKKNLESNNKFQTLQNQINRKFQFLEQQIHLYETEKLLYLQKIQNMKQQLQLRQSRHDFSFSNNYNQIHIQRQTQTEEITNQMDLDCFKSSIQALLEQNARFKKTITLLEQYHMKNKTQLPKEIEIEFQLNKFVQINK